MGGPMSAGQLVTIAVHTVRGSYYVCRIIASELGYLKSGSAPVAVRSRKDYFAYLKSH